MGLNLAGIKIEGSERMIYNVTISVKVIFQETGQTFLNGNFMKMFVY